MCWGVAGYWAAVQMLPHVRAQYFREVLELTKGGPRARGSGADEEV